MKKNTFLFLLLVLGFWAQAQSVTYMSPLTQTVASNQDSPFVIPNGVMTNPDFDYISSEVTQYVGSYLITASEMQAAGFEIGDNITSIGWELSQGQGESSTGTLSIFFVSTAVFPEFSMIPSLGYNLFPATQITIPTQPGMLELELAAPYIHDGGGLYITYYFTPTSYSSTDVLPLVGLNTNLEGGFKNRFVLGGENQGSVIEQHLDSRPVTVLAKPDCPFGYVTLEEQTEISATISWNGEGTYEIEYGVYPYEQGTTGGVTLPSFTTPDVENQYVITGLNPGTAYSVYVRKMCGSGEYSQWSQVIIGTSLESEVTEFPYIENFNPAEKYTFLYTRGWSVTESTTPYYDWMVFLEASEGFLGLREIMSSEINRTVYSRPLYLNQGYTYPMSLNYRLGYFVTPTSPNNPTLNILVNNSANQGGSTVITSIEDISNSEFQIVNFEFTPDESGVYYIGLNGVFAPGVTSTHVLAIDDFTVGEGVLSVNNFEKSTVSVYPNPFKDFIRISAESFNIDNLQVFDMKGALIYENNSSDKEYNIDVSKLTQGVYILKIDSGSQTIVRKMIKQ